MLQRLLIATLALGVLALGTTVPAWAEYNLEEQQNLKNQYRSDGLIVDFDGERGLPRRVLNARLGERPDRPVAGTPEEISARFLREHAELLFGTSDVPIDVAARGSMKFELVVVKTRASLSGTQVFRQQYSFGLPIHNALVQVNMDHDGQVLSTLSNVEPRAIIREPNPTMSQQDAINSVLASLENPGSARVAPKVELVGWYNGGRTYLTWFTQVALWSPYSDQYAYVDARTGEVLSLEDRMIHCNHKRPGEHVGRLDIAPPPEQPEPANGLGAARRVDGSGDVLPGNPLDDEPTRYGLRDGDPVVGYVENKVIPRLDGSGFLRGDYVDAINSSATRANEAGLVYNFSPDITDGNFHEVNVYWHIDAWQDYMQSTLGILNANNRQTEAAAHEGEDDNSSYSPATLRLRFGDGGVDDSEDGEVVLHEYGHAIHDNISGIGGDEAGAISEGFSDYIAASFSQNPIVAEWDATTYNPGPPPNLRRTDGTKHYPEDLVNQVHSDGEIISAAWWELNTLLGQEVADRLAIESFFLVGATTNMPEMADAYVQADQAIYGGAHLGTIFAVFGGRGMGPSYLLEIDHVALADTEDTAGPYPVVATILHTSPITAPDAVQMHWRLAGDPAFTTLTMNDDGGNQWSSSIPGPGGDASLEYYISVIDDLDVTASLPLNAPTAVLAFNVGTDFVPPVITHTPLGDQPLLVWPAEVRATVTDNLGVASVVCDYSLNAVPQGSFPLFVAGGDDWAADFPIPAGSLVFGDIIEYTVTATDASVAANQASSGPHSFEIIDAKGVVLILDDDDNLKDGGVKLLDDKTQTTDVPRDPAKQGASATQMAAALTTAGYVVTIEQTPSSDPGTWGSYSVLIHSSGGNTETFADPAYRAALVAYAMGGGKLMVEGGEVGWDSAFSPGYPDIVDYVTHAFDWEGDNSNGLVETPSMGGHPIRNLPNALPATVPLTYVGFGDQDGMLPNPDAYLVYSTGDSPGEAGVLVYDDNLAPQSAQIVYCAFNMAALTDPATADGLTENIMEFLLAEELGNTASLSGQVQLEGLGAVEGITVTLNGDPTTTDASGAYSFANLYEGMYELVVEGPPGFETVVLPVTLSNGQVVTGFDVMLRALVDTDITCNAAVTPIPDNDPAGVTSEIYVGDLAEISAVTVSVDITHTWRGDLIVDITSPLGTTVRLHNRTGGSASDLIETYSGLNQFAGESTNGIWTLTVSDNAGLDTGTLTEWCINMEAIAFGAVATMVGGFEAQNGERGVELSWNLLTSAGLRELNIERHVGGSAAIANREPLQVSTGVGSFVDPVADFEAGTEITYVLVGEFLDGRVEPISGQTTVFFQQLLPKKFALEQNSPNPFNPTTEIKFSLPANGRTVLRIYDLAGRLVKELVNTEMTAGYHTAVWNGRDNGGRTVASGSYIYQLQSDGKKDSRRMLLIK